MLNRLPSDTTQDVLGRIRVNDTTVIPGSEATTQVFEDGSVEAALKNDLAGSFIATLTSGDYITLQLQRIEQFGTGAYSTSTGIIVTVTRLTGEKGTAGAPGADGDITWEGTWVSQNYTVNEAVYYLGQSYVCKLNTVSSEIPTNTTYWDILAQKGDAASVEVDCQQSPATIDTTTTSPGFVDLPSASLTTSNTATTKYLFSFAGTFESSSANKILSLILNIDGVDDTDSEITVKISSGNAPQAFSLNATDTLANGKIVKVRWKIDGGTAKCKNGLLCIYGVN